MTTYKYTAVPVILELHFTSPEGYTGIDMMVNYRGIVRVGNFFPTLSPYFAIFPGAITFPL